MVTIDLNKLRKHELITLIYALDKKLDALNEIQFMQEVISEPQKKHNERNAGRKPKLTNEIRDKILDLHLNKNLSYRKISTEIGVSASTAHRIIQEHKKQQTNKNE